MNYIIRKAVPDDVRPALDLALRVFVEFEAPVYEPGAINRFRTDCIDNLIYIENYISGKNLMYIAADNKKIIGMVNENGNGHISMLFVDAAYHRHGIATKLMERIVCELKLAGFDIITVNSSPYALPFYRSFGFKPTDTKQKKDGFIFTPMSYIPNEIWDILDKVGNKTGRYCERGRKMAEDDYNLIVHVWKYNSKGEWLIDKRTARGIDLDNKWETTGGAAVSGDSSLTDDGSLAAALREAKEELGIKLDPAAGVMFKRYTNHGSRGSWFVDVWVFKHDCSINDLHMQKSEVCGAKWVSSQTILEMMASGDFVKKELYPYFDDMIGKFDTCINRALTMTEQKNEK
ncbi:MAG: GNAT family N-acetyltransferase [Treponema sp.]|nr:GNAT family N-acetyltransferase [Treponema sp.]